MRLDYALYYVVCCMFLTLLAILGALIYICIAI